MKAIVAGASGLVGSELLKLLLEDSDYAEIVVYTRRPLSESNPKLKQVIGELAALNEHRDELKGDVYFCCLGTTIKTAGTQDNFRKVDFHGVVSFGRLAFTHRAKKLLVVTASGAHSQSKFFYSRVKGEAEKALKDLKLNSLVILRPGLLVGDRQEKRTGEKIGISSFRVLRHLMPKKMSKKIGTEVSLLTKRIIEESKNQSAGLQIIEAKDI
jgi:uncharacterized protein YbjT (DUF2867 family)